MTAVAGLDDLLRCPPRTSCRSLNALPEFDALGVLKNTVLNSCNFSTMAHCRAGVALDGAPVHEIRVFGDSCQAAASIAVGWVRCRLW